MTGIESTAPAPEPRRSNPCVGAFEPSDVLYEEGCNPMSESAPEGDGVLASGRRDHR
jgi:hypothetical protein